MKTNAFTFSLLVFVALHLLGCSTGRPHTTGASEDANIRKITQDRRTWVEPTPSYYESREATPQTAP